MGNITDGTKILSITGSSDAPTEFISVIEEETAGLKLKYYIWLSRLCILFAIFSLLIFMSSSLALFKLAPQVNVEPFLIIDQDSSDKIVRYEPIGYDMASKEQLMEVFVRQYVITRNTIIDDEVEMQTRWFRGGMLSFFSSYDVFDQFEISSQRTWESMRKSKFIREVEIISIGKLGGRKSAVWKVDFKTYDLFEASRDSTSGALSLKVRYWTASVTAYFIKERIFMGRRLLNPLGFTVTRYSQTEVEIFN